MIKKEMQIVCGVLLINSLAYAQSNHVGGPNRRQESTEGYGQVTINVRRPGAGNIKATRYGSAKEDDKPTIYLGISTPIHIDAGLEYYDRPVNSTISSIRRKGWSIFMKQPSVDDFQFGYQRWVGNSDGTELHDVNFGQKSLSFAVAPGNGMAVSATGMPTLITVEDSIGTNYSGMRIKRVVGITQTTGDVKKNGSYLLGTEITLPPKALGKWIFVNGEWSKNFTSWPTNSPAPSYLPSNPQRIAGPGTRFIIDMNSPWQRNTDGSDQPVNAHAPSRLNKETINIDLRNQSKVKGQYGK